MNYHNMAIKLRPRNAWEAADLGIKLARRWWWPLLLLWLGTALPTLLVLLLLMDSMVTALLLFWWLKPLYEPALLFYLSCAVFGEQPSFRQVIKNVPRSIRRQLLPSLTYRRLSPGRAFVMPVSMLEGQKGKARTRRIGLLQQDRAGTVSFWTTITGAHIEAVIWLGVVTTILLLLPESTQLHWQQLLHADYLHGLCAVLAMALIAPFYVASGFALYLNRRIILEGWDLELIFKAMADQQQRRQSSDTSQTLRTKPTLNGHLLALVMAVLLASVMGLFIASPAKANDNAGALLGHTAVTQNSFVLPTGPTRLNPAEAKQAIEAVLQSTDFRVVKSYWRPRFINDWMETEDDASEASAQGLWLLELGEHLAVAFQWLAWLLVAVTLLTLIYYYRDVILAFTPFKSKQNPIKAKPGEVLNMDIREHSLPLDVTATANQLWTRGQCREALALLYRASLSRLVYHYDIALSKGSTEGDCLVQVKLMGQPPLFNYMQQLTQCWQRQAYAHQSPEPEEFQQVRQQWTQYFQPDPWATISSGVTAKGSHD